MSEVRDPATRHTPSLVPQSRPARVATLLLVALVYYASARLGLGLSVVGANVTPLWPPTGVAVAALLVLGRRTWPAIAAAAFAVNLPISDTLLAAAVTAVGNTAAPYLAVVLLDRVGFRRRLECRRDALAIVFIGALGAMLVSATIGASTLVVDGTIPLADLPTAWAVWWTGDAMGVLIVAPFLLSLPLSRELEPWPLRRWLEAGAFLVATTALIGWAAQSELPLLFVVLAVVGWAAWRLQLRGAAPVALVASLVATWAAVRDRGPFAGLSLLEQMATLQAFNVCVALASFVFGALVSERRREEIKLERAAAELEERVQQRTLQLSTANARLVQEIRDRSHAQEQLSVEEARSRREHEIAQTLQRSLLPDRIGEMPGVGIAARYVPATADLQVGGDWYDVMPLPDGLVGLAIGDVAGHGLHAAATMVQVRMALRAYALQDPAPASVMRGVHLLVSQLRVPEMVTLLYLVHDPSTGSLCFTNAGHPPALVLHDGEATYLEGGLAPPLGVTSEALFTEATAPAPPRRDTDALHRRPRRAPRRPDHRRPGAPRRGGSPVRRDLTLPRPRVPLRRGARHHARRAPGRRRRRPGGDASDRHGGRGPRSPAAGPGARARAGAWLPAPLAPRDRHPRPRRRRDPRRLRRGLRQRRAARLQRRPGPGPPRGEGARRARHPARCRCATAAVGALRQTAVGVGVCSSCGG